MHIKKHLSFSSLRELLSDCFNRIPEFRQNGKIRYSWHDVLMSGFACMYFQDPSLLQFQKHMQEKQHRNNLETMFGVKEIPKDNQMRNIIDEVDPNNFGYFFEECVRNLQRGKQLKQYEILPGLYLHGIDATGYFSSKNINCPCCLTRTHTDGEGGEEEVSYMHQALQIAIMHPDKRQVIPLLPEEIKNSDGTSKQDCETNAAKRAIKKLRASHPRLGIILVGDDIYSRQPMIEEVKQNDMHYLFVAKPTSHKFLQEWIDAYKVLPRCERINNNGERYVMEWVNNVPLHGGEKAIMVNYLRCCVYKKDRKTGEEKLSYQNSWATDLEINEGNAYQLARGGRCRWHVENECFNTLKNQGYNIEHNYGHREKNLCINFYILTLLAFTFHQVFELTDQLYQANKAKFKSKRYMWETLRAYIKVFIFETWEALLNFALDPGKYNILVKAPPSD